MKHLHDTKRHVDLNAQQLVYEGAIWNVQRDTFRLAANETPMTREYIVHPGAVAVVALDEDHRVAMINQYRHPVGQDCWEIPAGLMDTAGEDLLTTAQRELHEEADVTAKHWSVLVDHYPSAGSSTEAMRVFLAQQITPVPEADRHQRQAEEAHLTIQWVPLREAVDAVLAGRVKNVNAVAGLLAAQQVINGHHTPRAPHEPF